MSIEVEIFAALILSLIGVPLTHRLLAGLKLRRRNFRGEYIPAGFGILLVIVAVPVYAVMLGHSATGCAGIFLTAVIGFGAVGLIDDVFGSREVGGFTGHIGLLKKGRVSTGLIKAGVGGLLSLLLGTIVAGYRPITGILNGFIIALSANLLNLLDLRPGRAVSCFWAILLALFISVSGHAALTAMMLPIIISAAIITYLDRSAKVMLGDVGSNVLGGVLGIAMALHLSLVGKVVIAMLMIGVHLYSEKYSISGLIERNRVLRSVDRLLGER